MTSPPPPFLFYRSPPGEGILAAGVNPRPHFTTWRHWWLTLSAVIAGVLKSWFVKLLLDPNYYSNITEETDNEWKKTHGGKNVSETIKDYLVTYIGEPLSELLRYC